MLYHYTDRDSASDIMRDNVLRAHPVLIRTALIGGEEIALAPAVWFTPLDTPAPTILAKLRLFGWPVDKPGMIWRFGVADDVASLDLPAWAHPHGYNPELFRWMLLTAQLVGEDWQQWRLSAADVPRVEWLAVEELQGDGWHPVTEGAAP